MKSGIQEHLAVINALRSFNRLLFLLKTLPYHQRLVLYVIASNDAKEIGTNEIYEQYKVMCEASDTTPRSKARISGLISELDMLGLISARKFYKGRYGRIRLVASNVPKEKVQGLLHE